MTCIKFLPQLQHDFLLMAFCQLSYRGFELSLLIWKLYLPMNVLSREIYGEIFPEEW
jgi:hypothetical protein